MGDRLRGEQAQLLHHFIEVGEYGLALEEIAGALAQDKIAVTDQERGDMLAASARDASSRLPLPAPVQRRQSIPSVYEP